MKVIRKKLERDGSGTITLLPQDSEDIWHLYNIIQNGDEIETVTTRKLVNEKGNTRIRVKLCVRISKIEYDTAGNILRLNGKTCKDNKDVHIGSFHTLQIEPGQQFDLYKNEWDTIALERVDEACNIENKTDIAAIVLQPGVAHLCLVAESMTVLRQKVEVAIPRKKRGDNTALDKAMERFFKHVYQAVVQNIDLNKINAVLIAGPGNIAQDCCDFIFAYAQKENNQQLVKSRSKFVTAHASTGHLNALQEALNDPVIKSKLADTRYGREVQVMDQFFKSLNDDDMRAWYGPEEVQKAVDAGAVETLMITDTLFRSDDLMERKSFVALVEKVREDGKEVLIFSSLHASGEQLDSVSGIACLLLYPLDLETLSDKEETQ